MVASCSRSAGSHPRLVKEHWNEVRQGGEAYSGQAKAEELAKEHSCWKEGREVSLLRYTQTKALRCESSTSLALTGRLRLL